MPAYASRFAAIYCAASCIHAWPASALPVQRFCVCGLPCGPQEPTAGTPNFMAPELFEAKPFDSSVDVYALGVLLNEMFAREVPWDGYQPLDIKDKVVEGERPHVCKTMPTAAQSLLRRLWHQAAASRPKAHAAVAALHEIEDGLPRVAGAVRGDTLDNFSSLRLGKTM